ncbi:prolyl oligopeptidase family serine peptidase [Novosphingopyxis baekryungensis]|uniref:prolyl oligopeptidase family serine peptidase n=1 Tax=Novosphingopyxis baekryungensis TaxID=279369 RepID=UPI0003B3FF0B|nr:prolyl oligopeptidase family serine peptidase [Novosphingopyxis baekryungensis]
MRTSSLLTATALALSLPAALCAQTTERATTNSDTAAPGLTYPETRKGDVVEEQFGVKVADPYRWLENDVREDPEVAAWVQSEVDTTNAYLATLPGRDALAQRMKQLYDYARFGVPTVKGGHYFYTRNDGLQNQSVLYVRDQLNGEGRVLIDPNPWSKDGATALAEWVPSDDGTHLLYGIQDGGTDWRTVRVLDVATGEPTGDEIKWVKFSNLDWTKDGKGFVYSRFPEPAEGETFQALNEQQAVYYHALGTPQSADRLLFATPDEPKLNHVAEMTDDGRFALVTSSSGTDSAYRLNLIDLTAETPAARVIVPELKNDWRMLGQVDDQLYFATNKDAPRLRIVTMPVTGTEADVTEIVPEGESVIDSASIVGGKLVLNYLVDAKNEVTIADLDGSNRHSLALPGIGSVGGFGGDADQDETFFAFSSFTQPGAVYRLDMASETPMVWEAPKLAFNPDDYVTEQRFYASKDGTRIPMFVVRRKDVTGPAPTLLYGYGGFDISLTPGFSPLRMAWIDKGGVFAQANLRGGGEYGKAWHDGGRLLNKQNVFDDFIAAGEYLKAEGFTGPEELAIEGRSNGGLLVGAVVNQRPDLFAAAHAAVGVMDMLRFDRFTAGRYWVDDYGYPDREEDFRNLISYSPYHTIGKVKADYPAVIVSTADTDDRVVPGHSFKYIARLQATETGPMPKIIRIETRAGHGSGKPTDKLIAEYADIYAFLANGTGLDLTKN